MFAWFSGLTSGWQWALLVIVFLAGVGSGTEVTRWYYRAASVDALKADVAAKDAQIKTLQEQTQDQSDKILVITQERNKLQQQITTIKTQRDATYDKTPAIVTACIAPIRVSSVNQQRAAANSIRAR